MAGALNNGVVTEAGMAQLFADLASELSADGTTLSQNQLNDLKTIAANFNNGETASAYLTYVVDALIDGNIANEYWTGGAWSEISLLPSGTLTIGATATQIEELDGMWLLGTDLPSQTFVSDSYAYDTGYSTDSLPLYGPTGPSPSDINQGIIGDCYLLASLAEIAYQNPELIESMITSNGNGTFGVRFYVDGTPEYVTVNDQIWGDDPEEGQNTGPYIWASLIEKAYAELQASGNITGGDNPAADSWNAIDTGFSGLALAAITGASTEGYFFVDPNGSTWDEVTYNLSSTWSALTSSDEIDAAQEQTGLSASSALSALVADIADGDDVVLNTSAVVPATGGTTTLVSRHSFSVYGYDNATGDLEVRNPWGTEPGQTWDTTFEVSLSTLLSDDDSIVVDNTGSSVSVAAAAGQQANPSVTSFTVADTSAQVFASLDALSDDSKLAQINLTDLTTPSETLTYAQYQAGAAALADIGSDYNLTVTENVPGTLSICTACTVIASGSIINMTTAATIVSITGTYDGTAVFGDNSTITDNVSDGYVDLLGSGDQAIVADAADRVSVFGNNATATANGTNDYVNLLGSADMAILTGAEDISGIDGNDDVAILDGNNDSADFSGSNNSATLYGTDDVASIGSGNTVVVGSSGIGFISGTIDTLTVIANPGTQTVFGFNPNDGDQIDLRQILAGVSLAPGLSNLGDWISVSNQVSATVLTIQAGSSDDLISLQNTGGLSLQQLIDEGVFVHN